MSKLHIDAFGSGPPAVFVHGSFGWGTDTFSPQRDLADEYRVLLVDRRGFGRTPRSEAVGWPGDGQDIVDLLEELGGAHLVGQSYGAVVSLLAAGMAPGLVRSLTVIEPPLFDVAHGTPLVDQVAAAWKHAYDDAESISTEEFIRRWWAATGRDPAGLEEWISAMSDMDRAAAESTHHERWPGDAPVSFGTLASSEFPKVIVHGAWPEELAPGRSQMRDVFAAICTTIHQRIGGEYVVFERSAHTPQMDEADRFNELLRKTFASA